MSRNVPEAFRDPSGWEPTPLQLSVPPEARGRLWEDWVMKQPLYDPATLAIWLGTHGPDAPKPEKPVKKR